MITVIVALVLVILNLGAWIYGVYCYLQAFRYRRPGLPHYGIIPTDDQVLPAGRLYVRRWAMAWLVALGTTMLGAMLL